MEPSLKEWVKGSGCVVKQTEKFTVYELEGRVEREDLKRKIREVSIGPKNDGEVKTVLLLSESGAGKTTFLNAFLNVIFGVDIHDEVRLQLKEMDQSGPCHTTFLINHQQGMPYPFNYKVLDALSFGDADHDQANQRALKEYLANTHSIQYLNSIGLIWKSSSRRLDDRSKEIIANMKSLMSPEMHSITDLLITFSPNEDSAAIGPIKASNIAYDKVFHYDNAPLYQSPSKQQAQTLHSFMWESMVENHKQFLEVLTQRHPQNLGNMAKNYAAQAQREQVEAERLEHENRLDTLKRKLNDASNQLQTQEQELGRLKKKENEVDFQKLEALKNSQEKIVLDSGDHCDFCHQCGRACKPTCRDQHLPRNGISWSFFCKLCFPEKCQVCRHPMDSHKFTQNISASNATKEQRIKLLKQKQTEQLRGPMDKTRGNIDSLKKKVKEYKKQINEEEEVLCAMQINL